jgi:hypothetical protein
MYWETRWEKDKSMNGEGDGRGRGMAGEGADHAFQVKTVPLGNL